MAYFKNIDDVVVAHLKEANGSYNFTGFGPDCLARLINSPYLFSETVGS
jgi:hypothetical protein